MHDVFQNHPPSPIQEIWAEVLDQHAIELLVKRDDLLQPAGDDRFCGNKVRKLKYNLQAAREAQQSQLLTFGGAYSNHIAAVARAGKRYGFRTVGVIRGEAHEPLNPTLAQATADGMHLHYLDRDTYRKKDQPEILRSLLDRFGASYVLPEGGTNELALRGCEELVTEIRQQLGSLPDYLAVACGTGGTMAGIIRGCIRRSRVLGVSALKGNWMEKEIRRLLGQDDDLTNWQVFTDYHFGGYARFPPELRAFTREFEREHGIRLDPVYTCKLFYGILDLIGKGVFPKGSRIVVVHSGGLQGWNESMDQKLGLPR
ncbi:1-aminocyclopropane-1-carboxylate deaminase/D-cysteine desulfhydrase [Flavilitoribacter nigricans]|uniref:1-aminocyclopropane-1-carboxylate deaminase n=1 Tax=Flavilitoribacter nigricans (strain ATCC 23147 / DSM 23189 / NBRC 102662 / NCIMB 1420 / SS-2) TaxID=1122177 RepID=A0A2D0N4D4_FLAN2|nr:pyridoxal-phosphate dependent enzyme [Flavilitoribacter nigricans]PHN03248.1 1-aminocyclopropane-1-carboxylate deaminase [Flavilitoribacter nigricans DSM 23189 = NBRC 102662]